MKTSSILYPVKRHLKNQELIRETEILSISTAKRLQVEQGRFLKRE